MVHYIHLDDKCIRYQYFGWKLLLKPIPRNCALVTLKYVATQIVDLTGLETWDDEDIVKLIKSNLWKVSGEWHAMQHSRTTIIC